VSELGLRHKKEEDFAQWYSELILKAELADYADVKGFIILRPYGYAIWELVQKGLDARFKELGVRNAYYPLLIPEGLLNREAEHFKGFVPEVFWVTEAGDDRLSERLAIRPTSETIIYAHLAKVIKSYRDLPVKLNLWNSVLRAEIKMTKPFIRTSEFLWQEGHTAHATKEEAEEMAHHMLRLYERFMVEELALAPLAGKKSEREKFAGADYTLTLEGVMPDGTILQLGTSHHLGDRFARAFGIRYLSREGRWEYVWQTSWGVSWRLLGAVFMLHGDDKGLILPPRIAPIQAVIVPIYYEEAEKEAVLSSCRKLHASLTGAGIRTELDLREWYTPGWKFNDWELKGVPLRLELGPRDVKEGTCVIARRDTLKKEKVRLEEAAERARALLEEVQAELRKRALEVRERLTHRVEDYREFQRVLKEAGGFVVAPWCGSRRCEDAIKQETGADIRLIPLEPRPSEKGCIYCGSSPASLAYFGKAY
jgi:prolyl-tRNA synthetase